MGGLDVRAGLCDYSSVFYTTSSVVLRDPPAAKNYLWFNSINLFHKVKG